ncbi:Uncharacterised protein [uncultured Bacteroides sp.]|nr:Uncharacterised protein [uncultured Bacteroides sp.]
MFNYKKNKIIEGNNLNPIYSLSKGIWSNLNLKKVGAILLIYN